MRKQHIDPALQQRVIRSRQQAARLLAKQEEEKKAQCNTPGVIIWGADAWAPRSEAYRKGLALFNSKMLVN